MSSSSQNTPDQLKVDCFCRLRSPLRTALTDDNVGRRFLGCVNYHKRPDEKCKFFEWVDPETCARGKEFGRWIVKKNMDLQKNLADMGKKMEECKRSEEWFAVKVASMKNEMKEMEDGLKMKMEEWQKTNEEWQKREAWYAMKMEEVESKNADLRKKNKVLKDKVESEKWKVKVLASMVLAMVATVVMFFCGEGMWKKKLLALP